MIKDFISKWEGEIIDHGEMNSQNLADIQIQQQSIADAFFEFVDINEPSEGQSSETLFNRISEFIPGILGLNTQSPQNNPALDKSIFEAHQQCESFYKSIIQQKSTRFAKQFKDMRT